ncbi:MAG: hypothetical protein ACFFCQ_11710, partial [Promethearchaeota archaeon]
RYPIEDILRVFEARLHEKLITNDFTKNIRTESKNNAWKLIDGSVTSALFLNEQFKVVHIGLERVIVDLYQKARIQKNLSDNELRSYINQALVGNSNELENLKVNFIDADDVRPYFPIANPQKIINLHRTSFPHVWYETCDDSYLIALSKFIFQDESYRRALHLSSAQVSSYYIGQGTRIGTVSGNPDLITVDDQKKVHEVIQVKQIAITKPHDPVDLFRDITKTAGYVDHQGINRGLNVFFVKNTDLKQLGGSELSEGNNLIIVGTWDRETPANLIRFGQVVEAVREVAKERPYESDVSNQRLSKEVLAEIGKIMVLLPSQWKFLTGVWMKDLPTVDPKIVKQVSELADSTVPVADYYRKCLLLLASYFAPKSFRN